MAVFSKSEIAAAVAVNSKFSAYDVEDALEILQAVFLKSLQEGNPVNIAGIGTLTLDQGKAIFEPSEDLNKVIEDPNFIIKIQSSQGKLPIDLWTSRASIYKHRVNVGC